MRCISQNARPAFIWRTFTDTVVPVQNSLLLANALRDNDVPFEMHIYPTGGHGLSLGNEQTADPSDRSRCEYVTTWVDMCERWLKFTLGDFIR